MTPSLNIQRDIIFKINRSWFLSPASTFQFELPFAYHIFGRLCLYKYNELDSIKSRKLLSFLERFCPVDVKEEIGKIIEGFGDDSNENEGKREAPSSYLQLRCDLRH